MDKKKIGAVAFLLLAFACFLILSRFFGDDATDGFAEEPQSSAEQIAEEAEAEEASPATEGQPAPLSEEKAETEAPSGTDAEEASGTEQNPASADEQAVTEQTVASADEQAVTELPGDRGAKQKKEYRFRSKKQLDQHYEKHGIEMGFATAAEYEAAASAVINDPAALHKTEKEDGDDVYYLEASNEFVILSGDGYIRTYFLPAQGKKYYDRQ
ncbi:MAG: hypothetical protein K6E50_09675 [Lachnospiraceae bacterium]|nr:hypothetical protein [Lachnospiraceae bacterium]